MSATICNQLPGKTGASLDGVKCTPGGAAGGWPARTVDASHLIALAEAWERLAEWDDESRQRAAERGNQTTMILRADSAATYRRHAAALREIVAAAGMVQP